MPRRGARTGKGSKSSKTARVLGLLTNPSNLEEENPSNAAAQAERLDDKAAQAEIRSALEQELLGLLPNGDMAPGGGDGGAAVLPEAGAEDGAAFPDTPAASAPAAFPDEPSGGTAAPLGGTPEEAAPPKAAPDLTDSQLEDLLPPPRKTGRRARNKKRTAEPSAQTEDTDRFPAEPSAALPGQPEPFAPPEQPGPFAPSGIPEAEGQPAAQYGEEPSRAAEHGEPVAPVWPRVSSSSPEMPAPSNDLERESSPGDAEAAKHPEEYICFNLTQALVEEKTLKYMKLFGMCTCPRCRVDVTAIALCNLPVKYVATQNRDVVPLLSMYESKYSAEVVSQVISACKKVMIRPHHSR